MIIETRGLTKEYVRHRGSGLRRTKEVLCALERLDLSVPAGSSVGYIGANGAGKSTTIKMLIGILAPTSGWVRTCGLDPMKQRRVVARRVGVVFGQRSQLWWDLPLEESFQILAAIHRLSPGALRNRCDELIERLELAATLEVPVRQLSLGQRMRAEVAAALLHRPELVILDEPTIGLDVVSKQRLRDFLITERDTHGTTLLLTTHDMEDVEKLCDRILVLDHGHLILDGTLADLIQAAGARRELVIDLTDRTSPLDNLVGGELIVWEADGMRQHIAFDPGTITAAALLAQVQQRAEIADLTIKDPDIEDIVSRLYRR